MIIPVSKASLSYPNRIDECAVSDAYSSTNWLSTLPLSNVKNPVLKKVARTVTGVTSPDVPAKTGQISVTINVVLPQTRVIGCLALANHNLTTNATVRFQGFYNSNFTRTANSPPFDSTQNWKAYPHINPPENGANLFTDPNWWYGTIPETERKSYTPLALYYPPVNQVCQSIKIIITDINNTDNFIQIGRIFLGQTVEPQFNPEYGDLSQGYIDLSTLKRAWDGTKYFNKMAKMRTLSCTLKHLSQAEAFSGFYDAMREVGITGELIYSFSKPVYISNVNQTADQNFYARTFMCNFSELNPIEMPYCNGFSIILKLEEII